MEVPGAALPATLVACLLRSTQAVFFSVRVFIFQVGVSGVFFFCRGEGGWIWSFDSHAAAHHSNARSLALCIARASQRSTWENEKSRRARGRRERKNIFCSPSLAFCKMQEGERRRRLEAVSFALSQASRSLARSRFPALSSEKETEQQEEVEGEGKNRGKKTPSLLACFFFFFFFPLSHPTSRHESRFLFLALPSPLIFLFLSIAI